MSDTEFYNAARALKRELTGNPLIGLEQSEVDAFKAIFASWDAKAPKNPTALSSAAEFFKDLRASFGPLSTGQVEGIQSLLQAFGVARWPLSWAAYGLATAWWETNKSMQPVAEAYYLGDRAQKYRMTLKYYPWYGRGYPQLTHKVNYEWADEECNLNGALLANPELALRADIAAKIMVKGMEQGAFTHKKLSDFLPLSGRAGYEAYKSARRIINGTDKCEEIAKLAQKFESALLTGDWR
jgi:hypothetical protein